MRLAYSNNTNIGDTDILNRNGREYVLIEATEYGYIELANGNYESVRYEYERIHEQENDSLYEHIEKIRSQQRPNMWNIKYDERRTNGSGNSEYFGREEFQDNTTGNNEHLRTGNKNTSKQIKKSLDVDSEGTKLSVEQIKRYKNVAPELRDEQGRIKPFYHGTSRADRVGNYFNPERATSGPMAYFTDNAEIAQNYSKSKQELTQKIKQVTFDDDYETIILKPGNKFELIKNNDAEPLTNVGGTTKSGVSTTIGSASINNIPRNPKNSNTKNRLTLIPTETHLPTSKKNISKTQM